MDYRKPTAASKPADDTPPPHSIEAERGVLASMMLDPPRVTPAVIATGITEADYHSPIHATIHRHLVAMYDAGEIFDPSRLAIRLRESGDWAQIGGESTLLDLFELLPIAANGVWYAHTVMRYARLRAIGRLGEYLHAGAYSDAPEVDLLNHANATIEAIAAAGVTR